MQNTIPDLWPDYVAETKVLSPQAILRYQATRLRERTNNLLEAELVPAHAPDEKFLGHYFEIVAPVLNRYRYRVLAIGHTKGEVYPVYVFLDPDDYPHLDSGSAVRAVSQQAFIKVVQQHFEQPRLQSAIQSLLARSNEASEEEVAADGSGNK